MQKKKQFKLERQWGVVKIDLEIENSTLRNEFCPEEFRGSWKAGWPFIFCYFM